MDIARAAILLSPAQGRQRHSGRYAGKWFARL